MIDMIDMADMVDTVDTELYSVAGTGDRCGRR